MDDAPKAEPTESVVAAPKPPEAILKSNDFYVELAVMAGVLLLAAVVMAILDRWRKRRDCSMSDPTEQLTSFRDLYENGEITKGEYDRIRGKVAAKLKADLAEERTKGKTPPADPIGTEPE